jgi:hypothetical protein
LHFLCHLFLLQLLRLPDLFSLMLNKHGRLHHSCKGEWESATLALFLILLLLTTPGIISTCREGRSLPRKN